MRRTKPRINLLGMSTKEIEQFAVSLGQPAFRGRQIASWIYKRNASEIGEMSDLSAEFRKDLGHKACLNRAQVESVSESKDGTSKFLLKLADDNNIEAVLLPYTDRVSVCVSSQVGCPARCTFCATAEGGLVRNLDAGEIVDEVLTLQKNSERRISHVVYMGMGEPLLNYDPVVKSIHLLNDEVGIAMRHITLSTVGITPRIERLARQKLQITLAVSLHGSSDAMRARLMPITSRYPLKGLMAACKAYAEATRRRITFEYMLIEGVNDSLAQAHGVVELLRRTLSNVNLIPYNAVEGKELSRPTQAHIRAFRGILEKNGITVTQRMERGHSVSAACGQLRQARSRQSSVDSRE